MVAGFAVFSVLGFMSHEQGIPIADVAESGRWSGQREANDVKEHNNTPVPCHTVVTCCGPAEEASGVRGRIEVGTEERDHDKAKKNYFKLKCSLGSCSFWRSFFRKAKKNKLSV